MKLAKVWFPWKNRFGYVKKTKKTNKLLNKTTKIGRVYYCVLPSMEKSLLPYATDFHKIGERLY